MEHRGPRGHAAALRHHRRGAGTRALAGGFRPGGSRARVPGLRHAARGQRLQLGAGAAQASFAARLQLGAVVQHSHGRGAVRRCVGVRAADSRLLRRRRAPGAADTRDVPGCAAQRHSHGAELPSGQAHGREDGGRGQLPGPGGRSHRRHLAGAAGRRPRCGPRSAGARRRRSRCARCAATWAWARACC